jgi:hypothetical protein
VGVRRILRSVWPAGDIVRRIPTAEGRRAAMSGGTEKQKALEAIERLPPDATVEDAIEQLVLLVKIERGLAQLDAGQGVEHSEAKRRLLR